MSLRELEEAIKNQPDPVTGALGYVFDGDQIEEWIKRIEVKFDAFKKQVVCIQTKRLEDMANTPLPKVHAYGDMRIIVRRKMAKELLEESK